jgi:cytochrome c-type biogenesis protein CcmH
MIAFWIAAVALIIVGYVFFVPIFLGRTRAENVSRAKLNLLLHQQRQQELAREGASPEDLKRLAAESERNLLGDLETLKEHAAKSADAGRTLLVYALVSLPIFAFSIYLALGRPDLAGQTPPTLAEAQPEHEGEMRDDVRTSIEKLAERLKEKPDDLEGWILLGRSLQSTGQGDKAVQAYEFAQKLAPDNLDIKAMYAEALADANQGSAVGKPSEIIQEILAKDPNHKGGLWMAGVAAVQQKDTAKAVQYWEKLKSQFPADSDEAKQLNKYIAQAQGKPVPPDESKAAASASKEPAPAAQASKRLRVKVTLSDAVRAQAAPDDSLFIFARAAEGPPMPLAVVRKKASELPVEVTLDDTMSMMPGTSIASFDRLVIGARVSKTGKPTPTPGDLQGLTQPVAAKDGDSFAVEVNQVVGAK